MPTFYKLIIQDIQKETADAVVLTFAVPSELQSLFAFQAGQYVTIKCTLDGQELRRAYSLCSTPISGHWQIAIKAVKGGTFSVFANKHLKVGDLLDVSLPEGRFTVNPHPEKQRIIGAVAAGSGITPILSIVKTILAQEPNSSVVLLYGNQTPASTLFKNELAQLSQQYVGRFWLHSFYSQSAAGDSHNGRITGDAALDIFFKKQGDLDISAYYLCGPESLIQTVSDALKSKNVPEKKIHFELFNTESAPDIKVSSDGHTQVTVVLDGDESAFEMSAKQTVLEAALKHGVDAPYSCQGGICSSCLARVKEGSVEMKKNAILTDSELADGLILTCQAHPTSAHLVVDYDDV
jgi:ring-1,2-phenylacetyl-CoA epoxidase subunit PaaE